MSADDAKWINDGVAQRAGQAVLCMDSLHAEALIATARPHPIGKKNHPIVAQLCATRMLDLFILS